MSAKLGHTLQNLVVAGLHHNKKLSQGEDGVHGYKRNGGISMIEGLECKRIEYNLDGTDLCPM